MKKIIILIFSIVIPTIFTHAQCNDEFFNITFDDAYCVDRVIIDTISDTNNVWQIGTLNKAMADSNVCSTVAIMTDTINPYPVNDTSSFVIKTVATYGIYYGCKNISGMYYAQTDSLNDYGMIEFSPDNGLSWVDLLNDTVYGDNLFWYSKPVLTGHSGVCKFYDCVMFDIGSAFGINVGDTLLFRFTFISDSIFDNASGLLFDDFSMWDYVEGISETRFRAFKSKVYPNPVDEQFTIGFDNPDAAPIELAVYDIHSKPVLKQENITREQIILNAADFKPGIYIYKLTNFKESKRSWGKFVVIE